MVEIEANFLMHLSNSSFEALLTFFAIAPWKTNIAGIIIMLRVGSL
jgi:hypothetical protein